MTSALISDLQASLRRIASGASGPLMAFLDSCAQASGTDGARLQELAVFVGHEAKAIARIGQVFAWLESVEPGIADAEMIQEVMARFYLYKKNFHGVVEQHHMAEEMSPFIRVVEQSIAACTASLAQAGGAVPRRSLKLALQELLGESELRHTLQAPGIEAYAMPTRERILSLSTLPALVGMGVLTADTVRQHLVEERAAVETARRGIGMDAATDPMTPLLTRIDGAIMLCDHAVEVA